MEKPDQRDYDFSSQEGYDQYDAAVAKYNRQQEGPKIGTELADKIEGAVGFVGEQASKIPFIRTGLQFLGGSVKTIDNVMTQDQGPGGMIYRTYKNVKSASEEGFGDLAENVGVDRRYGSFFGGELIDTAVTAGTGAIAKRAINVVDKLPPGGMSQQLATATVSPMGLAPSNGSISLRPQVMELTLKDPTNIPEGIKHGSAKLPEWKDQMNDYFQRRANIKERLQAARDRKSRNVGAYQDEAYNTISTGASRNPELNPEAYGEKKVFDQFKEQSEITPLTSKGNIKWQQQHHLFSKQESYQFVERMIELGDDDDVLALFIMAEDMDATLGGRLSNMLNMEDLPHSVLHGSRITDKRQLQAAGMRNLVENAKSTDELMRMFREYVTENVQPSIEEAKAFKIIGQRLMKANKYKSLDQIRDKMYR